jgi:hypothetical protein
MTLDLGRRGMDSKGFDQRLDFQKHPWTTAIRCIIDRFVSVGGKIPKVMGMKFNGSSRNSTGPNFGGFHIGKDFGKYADYIEIALDCLRKIYINFILIEIDFFDHTF